MANLSRASFFDAGKNPPRTRVVTVDGRRRKENYPNGVVERWVDPHGNVVFQQLVAPGVPVSATALDNSRASIRRRPGGWIEHHRCPLSQGTLEPEDFPDGLQTICKAGTFGTDRACKHVEHAIAKRQGEHAAAREERHAVLHAEKRRKEALEAAAVEQTRQLNDNLAIIVGDAARRAAAPTNAPESASVPGTTPAATAATGEDVPKKPPRPRRQRQRQRGEGE